MANIRRRNKSSDSTSKLNTSSKNSPPKTSPTSCVVALASPVVSPKTKNLKKPNNGNFNNVAVASLIKSKTESLKKSPAAKDSAKKVSFKTNRSSNHSKTSFLRKYFDNTYALVFLLLIFFIGLAFIGVLNLSTNPSRNPNSINNVFAPISGRLLDRVSDSETFLNPVSPQSRAKVWALSENGPSTVQRYILAVFYFSFQGDGWRQRKGWLNPSSECTWKGITCNNRNEVSMLWLTDNFLVGSLPMELSYLSTIDTITLNDNDISGPLPISYFTQLIHLRQLSLYNNRLTGRIPDEMYDRALEYIGLQENILHGTISTRIGKLKKLHTFYLHGNRLTGTIPKEVVDADSTVEIALEDNFLTGSLPSRIGKLKKLRWLSVQHNKLTGYIPKSLGDLQGLKTLYLYNNEFRGVVPPELCLSEFRDFYTDCGGHFPKVACSCCTACCSSAGCFKDTAGS